MTELPVWTCDLNEAKDLTVGRKFGLKCHGDIDVAWKQGPLAVIFPKEEDNYSLVVLANPKMSNKEVELVVTGYKPGKHQPDYMRIVQGETGFEVQKPQWEIQSVIKQGEKPQPYESVGPWSLGLPLWFLISFAIVLLALFYIGYRVFRRIHQRRKMLAELERHKTTLSPLHQFYRDSRGLRRRLNQAQTAEDAKAVADDLNREFRLYVLRQFQIPTLDWSNRAIIADLRRRHRRVYRRAGANLGKTLRELTRLSESKTVLLKDVEQMHRLSMESAERLDQAEEGKR